MSLSISNINQHAIDPHNLSITPTRSPVDLKKVTDYLNQYEKKIITLAQAASFLNQYDWSQTIGLDQSNPQYQAYLKVCGLANELLLKGDRKLFLNVSENTVIKTKSKVVYSLCHLSMIEKREVQIEWNPCVQVKHIKAVIRSKSPNYWYPTIRIFDAAHQLITNEETHLSQDALSNAGIIIGGVTDDYIEDKFALPDRSVLKKHCNCLIRH